MRANKGSRLIIVRNVEFRWRATGNDGYISINIWPTNNVGPNIWGTLGYQETWIDKSDGSRSSAGDQIVVTNRLIERIIDYAITERDYDPSSKGEQVKLGDLESLIKWQDAVRASDRQTEQ